MAGGSPQSASREWFTTPHEVNHRRYEALRAFFVEGLTHAAAGERFGYTRWAMVNLVREHRAWLARWGEQFGPPGPVLADQVHHRPPGVAEPLAGRGVGQPFDEERPQRLVAAVVHLGGRGEPLPTRWLWRSACHTTSVPRPITEAGISKGVRRVGELAIVYWHALACIRLRPDPINYDWNCSSVIQQLDHHNPPTTPDPAGGHHPPGHRAQPTHNRARPTRRSVPRTSCAEIRAREPPARTAVNYVRHTAASRRPASLSTTPRRRPRCWIGLSLIHISEPTRLLSISY